MTVTLKISREALKNRDFKNRETKKSGKAPDSRDTEALAELLKALKKT